MAMWCTTVGQELTGSLTTDILHLPNLNWLGLYHNKLTGQIPTEYAGHFEKLELHYNLLTGTLPSELFAADSPLEVLNVGKNNLTGSISDSIGQATKLSSLLLFGNSFVGTIPKEIALLPLKEFQANQNFLTGPLPLDVIGPWTNFLRQVWLSDNLLTSTIPLDISSFLGLQDLRLSNNKLEGSIPPDLYDLAQLNMLYLEGNSLTGSLSARVVQLSRLRVLDLSQNSLGGNLPAAMYQLVDLKELYLDGNDFGGTLATAVGSLDQLETLLLSDNQLTGPIPLELASLVNLKTVELNFNQFAGSIPVRLCSAPFLLFLQADCLPPDAPPNSCQCCTHCCSRDDLTCEPNTTT
jgi:Leucine-rich repeat (LRR) protein